MSSTPEPDYKRCWLALAESLERNRTIALTGLSDDDHLRAAMYQEFMYIMLKVCVSVQTAAVENEQTHDVVLKLVKTGDDDASA